TRWLRSCRWTALVLRVPAPAWRECVWHAELIERARDDEVDQLSDARRPIVKTGCGRHHHGARERESTHVLEVDQREWRLTRDQQQAPPFLERHISRALDQRARRAGRDARQRAHRAGA